MTTTTAAPTTYRVVFARIGRNHNVPDLVTTARDADDLAGQVYRYARPHLGSSEVDVLVDGDRGRILVGGFRSGGDFTVLRAVSA